MTTLQKGWAVLHKILTLNSTQVYLPKRNERDVHKKTYTRMFTVVLFIVDEK